MFLTGGVQARRLWYHSVRNFGATEKQLLLRLKVIKNIAKITKSMKMIASTKMRGDMRRLDVGKHFAAGAVDRIFETDAYMQRKSGDEKNEKKTLLVPVTSDKGLCGGINSGIRREVVNIVGKDFDNYRIFVIGEKGSAALRRPFPEIFNTAVTGLTYPINYSLSMAIAEMIKVEGKGMDSIKILYNEFINAISFKVREIDLMGKERFDE